MKVFVVGYPSSLGGADTELWHVLRLWRKHGVEVILLPTWNAAPDWKDKCDSICCKTIELQNAKKIDSVAGLEGSVVVSFCNGEFLKHADRFRKHGCRVIWVGCMTWAFSAEREHYAKHGPFEAYVFQSKFQQSKLLPELENLGVSKRQCFRIPGPFDVKEFPYAPRPHKPESDFYVGRLARPDLDKWHEQTWGIMNSIPYAKRRARVMGWNDRLANKLGMPPDWVELLSPSAETAYEFLKQLHCMISINGGAQENWPRVGLEAMSTGVPVIAENAWGWQEMIEHGKTGFLANNNEEFAYYTAQLAMNEKLRLEIVKNARARLESILANPDTIWSHWNELFEYVKAEPSSFKTAINTSSTEGLIESCKEEAVKWDELNKNNVDSMTARQIFQAGFEAGSRYSSQRGDRNKE